jgi:predicted nucleic acid-binding protein
VQSILADAGPIIALFREKDPLHAASMQFVTANTRPLLATWPVVTEVCHFLDGLGKSKFLTWIRRGGVRLHPITDADIAAIHALIDKYGDRMDLADATLVWLGAKLKISDIVTIDRDDFSVYRAGNGKPFRNLFPPV